MDDMDCMDYMDCPFCPFVHIVHTVHIVHIAIVEMVSKQRRLVQKQLQAAGWRQRQQHGLYLVSQSGEILVSPARELGFFLF